MSWARVHRWLAIVLAVLLAVWSITGLLFHLKPGWDRAYDMPSVERRDAILPAELATIATVRVSAGMKVSKLELFDTAIGPLYRASTETGPVLIDAVTGAKRSPLDEAAVRTLVTDAVGRSSHAPAYGEIESVTLADDTARVVYTGGPVVEIGRSNARLSQRGGDTDRIDWLYRVHYLQWTGNKTVDRALGVVGLALIWAVVVPGLVLFKRRRKAP